MIDLYTAATPNGWKASIMLEECGLPYEPHILDLGDLDQKKPEYLKIRPRCVKSEPRTPLILRSH